MPFVFKRLALVLSIAVVLSSDKAWTADKDAPKFTIGPASSYPAHQTSEKVTIAAVPYTSEEQVRLAFGKVDPNKYGILPVLVVIQNDTGQALRLDAMRVEYVTSDRTHMDATPAKDVPYLRGALEPLGVLGALEDCARVRALALEYAARVVQTVGENVEIGLAPGHHFAVIPDDAVEPVVGFIHGVSSWCGGQGLGGTDQPKPGLFASRPDTRYGSVAP